MDTKDTINTAPRTTIQEHAPYIKHTLRTIKLSDKQYIDILRLDPENNNSFSRSIRYIAEHISAAQALADEKGELLLEVRIPIHYDEYLSKSPGRPPKIGRNY